MRCDHRQVPGNWGPTGLTKTQHGMQTAPKAGHATLAASKSANPRARPVWLPNESDELLRLAVQVGGIGIYNSDIEHDRTRFSPELCAILGLPPGSEMTYAEASRLFDARDRAVVNARLEAARRSPMRVSGTVYIASCAPMARFAGLPSMDVVFTATRPTGAKPCAPSAR